MKVADFRLWHKCEMPAVSSNVRFLKHTGRHLLKLSSFEPNPTRTSLLPAIDILRCALP
jgi:hypothetical protein